MNVLGFSAEHDSGTAFIKYGRIIYAANEERFNREKFTTAIPHQSFLEGKKMFPDFKFDLVAVGSKIHIIDGSVSMSRDDLFQKVATLLNKLNLERFFFTTTPGLMLVKGFLTLQQIGYRASIKKILKEKWGIDAPVVFVDHHVAHAAGAYFTSPYRERPALVVTLDAAGDGVCSRAFLGEYGKLKKLHEIPFFHSPAYYYMYITKLLGFRVGEEGKVMGLAAVGDPSKTLPIFESRIKYDEKNITFINEGSYRWTEYNYLKEKLAGFSKEDISAGLQAHLENMVVAYIKGLVNKYIGHPIPVALAGGVFSNVRLNQKIKELPEVTQVYIFPNMGDGGLAAGSALAVFNERVQLNQPKELENVYFGPAYEGKALEEAAAKYRLSFIKNESPAKQVAKYLAEDKIVAVSQGRMEFGPRALGNRTILASAKDRHITDRLNDLLKRNDFMPFAPIIRDIDAPSFFHDLDKCRKPPEFMTITVNATEKCKNEATAIVHFDGTARPQIVSRDINPLIYDILTEYDRLTGLKVLINTSFNMHGEPIVCTPEDAVKSFIRSKMDVLLVDDYILPANI
jgi:carbamoyltransferase